MTDKNELPDGGLSKSTAKRVTALAAASVSERARALMAQAYRDGGFPRAAGILEAGVIDSVDSCALRAIEQALTQQRACATCGGRGEIGGHVGQTAETFDYVTERCPECTTPQPSSDAVREVPDGMVLVPREPTEAMVIAGESAWPKVKNACCPWPDPEEVYAAMLSAASDHQQNAAQGGGEK